MGNCRVQYLKDSNVRLHTDCSYQTKALMVNVLNTYAFVVGDNIFTYETSLDNETISHEMAHVHQYKILGPLFLPLYGISQLSALLDSKIGNYPNVHAGNFFEIWANKIAGLSPEEKY